MSTCAAFLATLSDRVDRRRGDSREERQLRSHHHDWSHNTDGLARRRQFTHTKTEHTDIIRDDGCVKPHTNTHLKHT